MWICLVASQLYSYCSICAYCLHPKLLLSFSEKGAGSSLRLKLRWILSAKGKGRLLEYCTETAKPVLRESDST